MAPKENDNNGDSESPRQQAANDARQNFINEMNQVFDEILADKSTIKPMTYIPAGTRIIVYPNVDLWLRTYENDAEAVGQAQKANTDVFIDTEKRLADADAVQKQKEMNNARSSSVVYSEEDADIEAMDADASQPLIDESKYLKKKKPAASAAPVSPPPPPSTGVAVSAPGGNRTSGRGSSNSNPVPALF